MTFPPDKFDLTWLKILKRQTVTITRQFK